mgnify:CR=1 FL=1|tara:strand:+ start:2951 stop:3475 length:525 start_codon:yes stop_codon:yes gene_type:complete
MQKHLVNIILCISLTPFVFTGCAANNDKDKKSLPNKTVSKQSNTQSGKITPILSPTEADRKDYKKLRQTKMIYFNFDQSSIQPAYAKILRAHAAYLIANPNTKVKVEGHCDERGTPEYNIALGERRSKATIKYLQRLGVSKDQMTSISYGEEKPLDSGHNAKAYAKNRRAVIVY